MLIEMCYSKIAHAIITEANLHYEGSITIDEGLMRQARLLVGQKVHVLNINNGQRFETYVIKGRPGEICLNGPAARLGLVGDKIMILSYVFMTPDEARDFQTVVFHLDERNQIKN
jgi:aspartate 1-decarboxylase